VGTTDTQTLTNKTIQGGAITSGTNTASTSGTSIDFTGIPSWVKRITVLFNGMSTTGTSDVIIRIGTLAGGFVTTGYASAAMRISAGQSYTAGFGIYGGAFDPTYLVSGACVLFNVTGNTWVESGSVGAPSANTACPSAGMLALGGVLDRVRITTVGGTDTFDAGSINILYE
jgi:hypothetical protein